MGAGKSRADEDAVVEELVEGVAEEQRRNGVGAGGEIRNGVITVAVGEHAVARAGGDADAGEALAGERDAAGDGGAGVAAADDDEEVARGGAAFHVGDRAGDDILAGGGEAAGEGRGVWADDGGGGGGVVGGAPVVGECVAVGIGGGGGKRDGCGGRDVERRGGERERRRAVAGERPDVHPHIGAALAGGVGGDGKGGEMEVGVGIGKSLADDEGRVGAAGGRGRRGVDELEILAAVEGPAPAEDEAVRDPLVFRVDQGAQLGPVSALGVLGELERVAMGRVELRLVEGVEAVGAARGDGLDEIVGEPADLVLGLRVEVVAGKVRAGGAHDVEDVAVFKI